jgi:glycosyltransferase involved in cell wall biosynthesis
LGADFGARGMKVLAFTPLYLPVAGGIEMIVADLSSALRRHGIETAVVTDAVGYLPGFEIIDGTHVHRLPLARCLRDSNLQNALSNIQALSRILEIERPDILHVHSATQAGAFYLERVLKKQAARLPLVVTQHGALESTDKTDISRRLITAADLLTAVSREALASAIAFTGRTAPAQVIHNGIAIDAGVPVARVMPERHRLLCVGRMEYRKGFDLAIEALAIVLERGVSAELLLVGHGENRPQFELRAQALQVSEHVRFLGTLDRSRVKELMAESSILLVPSRTPREGFGLVAAEAASVGTPCIVSDVGGLPETVKHNVTGFVVSNEDVEALGSCIVQILTDGSLWSRLSARSYEHATESFSLAACVDGYAAAYRRVLGANRTDVQCGTM